MDHRTRTLEELQTHRSRITAKNALLGFDGFVDKIMHVVDRRTGPGAQSSGGLNQGNRVVWVVVGNFNFDQATGSSDHLLAVSA